MADQSAASPHVAARKYQQALAAGISRARTASYAHLRPSDTRRKNNGRHAGDVRSCYQAFPRFPVLGFDYNNADLPDPDVISAGVEIMASSFGNEDARLATMRAQISGAPFTGVDDAAMWLGKITLKFVAGWHCATRVAHSGGRMDCVVG